MGRLLSVVALALMIVGGALQSTRAAPPDDMKTCNEFGAKIEEVIAACTRLINSGRYGGMTLAVIYHSRGFRHMNKGAFDAAMYDFNESVRLAPRWAPGFVYRGLIWTWKGDYDKAIADLTQARRLDPKNPEAPRFRGKAYTHKGDFDKAIADLTEAIRLDAQNHWNYADRGFALLGKGEHDKAITDFNEALRLWGNYADGLAGRGEAYRLKGDLDKAIADFSRAIGGKSDDPIPYALRGQAYESKGDTDRALEDYVAALGRPGTLFDTPRRRAALATARERMSALTAAAARLPKPVTPTTATVTADPGRRVALVIGNATYRGAQPLANPARDAELLAAALRSIGFDRVMIEKDLARDKFIAALRRLEDEAATAQWALIFFAGHGVEMGGVNYLIPVDARLSSDRDVQDEAIALDRVLLSVESAKKLRLVILDACRDNPFVSQMRRTVATRSIGRGFARVEPEAGTLVVYAAKHGETALDGDGSNSPFVTALVGRIRVPGIEVRRMFDLVRDDVLLATERRQQPFTYGSLTGSEDFFFVATR